MVCDMSIPFGVTHVCSGRGLYGSASLSSVTRRGQAAGRAITLPPGVAPDRLETSGHIWEGSADGGERVGLAVREQPCSGAASQNSLFTAKLQTRRKTRL